MFLLFGSAELFESYGDGWFVDRKGQIGPVPLSDDFIHAEKLIQMLWDAAGAGANQSLNDDVLPKAVYNLILSIRDVFGTSRTLNAFPDTWDQAHLAVHKSISAVHQPSHVRTREWLQEHGHCIDHMTSGISTLDGAGLGAFAKRKLHEGQIITVSPLFHYPQTQYDAMAIYATTWDEATHKFIRHLDRIESYQVALNYCFGHTDSSLLLCPYGSGVNLINHGKSANVKIRWPSSSFLAHQQHHVDNSTLQDLERFHEPLFAFEYVALTDIGKGEELMIDYGKDWEEAWNLHRGQWFQSNVSKNVHINSVEINELLANAIIRTHQEQLEDPYPGNLELRCHNDVILNESSISSHKWRGNLYGHPCRVLDRYPNEDESCNDCWWYLVDVEVWPSNHATTSTRGREPIVTRIIKARVPRQALRFFDKPGTTDLILPSAFRHWIGISDELFPAQWRNRR